MNVGKTTIRNNAPVPPMPSNDQYLKLERSQTCHLTAIFLELLAKLTLPSDGHTWNFWNLGKLTLPSDDQT
jgi:hypothetical protein